MEDTPSGDDTDMRDAPEGGNATDVNDADARAASGLQGISSRQFWGLASLGQAAQSVVPIDTDSPIQPAGRVSSATNTRPTTLIDVAVAAASSADFMANQLPSDHRHPREPLTEVHHCRVALARDTMGPPATIIDAFRYLDHTDWDLGAAVQQWRQDQVVRNALPQAVSTGPERNRDLDRSRVLLGPGYQNEKLVTTVIDDRGTWHSHKHREQ